VFIGLGLSGVVPAMHYVITDGLWAAINHASLGWLILMAVLYIAGALIYAWRIPERIWPGKFDIWVIISIDGCNMFQESLIHLLQIYYITAYA
jgi:predicted membrane channel-forming protein YqfA (hemolysin III family)